MSVLTLKFQVHASSLPPETAVRELVMQAVRLNCWCKASINGIDVLASPTDRPDVLVGNYIKARNRKATFVSANVIPLGRPLPDTKEPGNG